MRQVVSAKGGPGQTGGKRADGGRNRRESAHGLQKRRRQPRHPVRQNTGRAPRFRISGSPAASSARHRGFAGTALLTLGVRLVANVAMFVVNSGLLNPLPVPDAIALARGRAFDARDGR
jgi:hypothetical protein